MLKFLARIFGGERSGQTAKERLKLVLLSDHLSLAPDVVEALKSDLLAVIGKYVEIDTAHVVVDFEHREHEIALTANVPILAMRERPLTDAPPAVVHVQPAVLSLVPPVAQPQAVTPVAEAAPIPQPARDEPVAAPAAAEVMEPVAVPPAPAYDVASERATGGHAVMPGVNGVAATAEPEIGPVDGPASASEDAAASVDRAPVESPGVDVSPRPLAAPKPRSRRRRRKGGAAPVGTAPLGKAAKA